MRQKRITEYKLRPLDVAGMLKPRTQTVRRYVIQKKLEEILCQKR